MIGFFIWKIEKYFIINIKFDFLLELVRFIFILKYLIDIKVLIDIFFFIKFYFN